MGFTLDKEKDGDHVIMDKKGDKLLLLEPDMASLLMDMTLDYRETKEEEMVFTLGRE
jgi:hypothetical protein